MDKPKTIQFIPTRFFESFIAVARELIFRPRHFFEQLCPSGSLFGPLIFLMVCIFFSTLFVSNTPGANLNAAIHPLKLFAALLVSGGVSAVLGSLCLHVLLVSPLCKTRMPYEATLSVIAYASIIDLVAWIPLIDIAANIYGLFLMYLGFKIIHQLSARRAAVTVFAAVMLISIVRLMMIRLTAPEWLDALMKAIENNSIPS